MNKQQLLNNLKQQEEQANLPLKDTATNIVFGEGNPDAKVFFLGEAPGRQEDKTGRPFVGSAGQILSKLLESIELSREDVYITSVLRYRPPKNRDPKPSEITSVQPFLDQQIKIISPKVIATLGRHSLKKFLPNAKIAEIHGKPQKISWNGLNLIIIPLYHPAAVIYNRNLQKTLDEDFKQITTSLKKI